MNALTRTITMEDVNDLGHIAGKVEAVAAQFNAIRDYSEPSNPYSTWDEMFYVAVQFLDATVKELMQKIDEITPRKEA